MKIVQINLTCAAGSTGKICVDISRLLSEKGIENYILYSLGNSDYPLGIRYMNNAEIKFGALGSRISGYYGFRSAAATKRLLARLDEIKPDIVHLHNLHGHNCQLELLINYLKRNKIKVFWTFHDCWAFTAYCPHFTMSGCDKWEQACRECPERSAYSWFFDRSRRLFERKKELLHGLDLTIITPSKWLGEVVGRSFLKDCELKVINNGIDLSVFKPTQGAIKEKYGISDEKYVLLGVASVWGPRKGFDVFLSLYERLDRDKYQIVLVGVDEKRKSQLPPGMIGIAKTQDQKQLAELYSAAELFVNPTREDSFPTVNLEALACGTPVITFAVGGSPECVTEKTGCVVEPNDVEQLCEKIEMICENKKYNSADCVLAAKSYDKDEKFAEYIRLYENAEPEKK